MSPRGLDMKQVLRWMGVAAMAAAVAACGDRPAVTGADIAPPPVPGGQPAVLGGWEVAVDSAGNVNLSPSGTPNASTVGNGISAAVYGTQNVNVRVYAAAATVVTKGGTKTWTLNIGVRNLLNYPIGANQNGPLPSDTLGVYLAVYSPPAVTATSGTCPSPCTVSVTGYDGTGNFTSTAQPYLYWQERPTAVQPVAGTDTVSARRPLVFTGPSAVTNFRFYVIVAAAWPPPAETFWSVFYNAATDTLPETNAKPTWKKAFQLFGLGSDTWSSKNGGQLTLLAKSFNDILLYRADSIAPAMPAYIEGKLHVAKNGPSQPETVLFLQDGSVTAAVGVQAKKIGFVQAPYFNWPNYALGWSLVANSPTYALDATQDHTYRLRKFGTDSVTVEVDGVRRLGIAYNQLPGIGVYMPATASAGFGASSGTGNSNTTVSYVTYGLGQSQP
jgi:hypothetical protein